MKPAILLSLSLILLASCASPQRAPTVETWEMSGRWRVVPPYAEIIRARVTSEVYRLEREGWR
jgi:hypothetical protein